MLRFVLLSMVFVMMSSQLVYGDMKLAYKYLNNENYEAAYWEFQTLATNGDAEAQYELGLLYNNGTGVKKNAETAFSWYEKAANKGYDKAQNNLAVYYYDGDVVPQDYIKAIKWFNEAAKLGNIEAQNSLGYIYRNGKGAKRDYKKAMKWYRNTADNGSSLGQYFLGMMYLNGEGVAKNKKEAIKLLRKSAAQGDKDAIEKLAELAPAPKSFSQADACRIVGNSAACGVNVKSVNSLIRSSLGGTSASDMSNMTQYQSCFETVYDIARTDLKSKTANFTCSETKKELQELTVFLKNFK